VILLASSQRDLLIFIGQEFVRWSVVGQPLARLWRWLPTVAVEPVDFVCFSRKEDRTGFVLGCRRMHIWSQYAISRCARPSLEKENVWNAETFFGTLRVIKPVRPSVLTAGTECCADWSNPGREAYTGSL